MRRTSWLAVIGLVLLAGEAGAHVRLLVRNTNWYYTRHHCYIGVPDEGISGGTGMGRGATELRVGGGDVTFVHQDVAGIWPPIAYRCPTRLPGGPEVALDLTFKWVYVADGLSWTHGCRSFAQTFVAEGPELVSVRCFVASPPRPILVTLHEGGPDGRQIGHTKQFSEGAARWGLVYWNAGEAALTPGERYAIVMRSQDATPWNPYVHSKGNCYDDGHAYFDHVPQPDTDLCLLISNPDDGYIRHVAEPNDPRDTATWSDIPNGQRFAARGENLVFASLEVECGGDRDRQEPVYLVVRRGGSDGERVGQRMKMDHLPGPDRSVKERGVPFGPRSVPLEVGETYVAMLEYESGERPADWRVRMRLYGEEVADAHPTVASVWTGRIFPDSIEVVWRKGNASRSIIEYGIPGGRMISRAEEMGDEGWAAMGGLSPDTLYQFRLIATSPQGFTYHSPWYLVRTCGSDGTLRPVEPVQRFGVFDPFFLPVAEAPLIEPPQRGVRLAGRPVSLENPGFENGTQGWQLTGDVGTVSRIGPADIQPHEGESMIGWLRKLTGEPNHEFYAKDRLEQRVTVRPGRWYQMSAWVLTAEPAWDSEQKAAETWAFPFFQSRCRDRVALFVDPEGSEEFEGANVTQWYSTESEWMLVTKCFQAKSSAVRLGAFFYQRGQREWDAAVVDDVRLVELDEAPY